MNLTLLQNYTTTHTMSWVKCTEVVNKLTAALQNQTQIVIIGSNDECMQDVVNTCSSIISKGDMTMISLDLLTEYGITAEVYLENQENINTSVNELATLFVTHLSTKTCNPVKGDMIIKYTLPKSGQDFRLVLELLKSILTRQIQIILLIQLQSDTGLSEC